MKPVMRITGSAVLFLLYLISGHHSYGQLFTSSNISFHVTPGTTMTVEGDVLFNPLSSVVNNGVLEVSGNFTNNSGSPLFGISSGVVSLNGINQSISGSSQTLFHTLQLLNGGIKTLFSNTTVGGQSGTGSLILNNSVLVLNHNLVTISNPSSGSAITRSSGFIHSEDDPSLGYSFVDWQTGPLNPAQTYEIPFGNLGTASYLPVRFTASASGTGPGSLKVATYPTDPTALPNNRPLPTGLPVLTNFAGVENAANTLDRYWVMEVSGYTTLPVADIQLTYREQEWATGTNTIIENTLQPQRHDLLVWSPPTGVVNTTTNTATITGVNNFNTIWTLAGNASPLPVELLYFEASPVDDKEVLCSWMTATEINNDYFIVERSADGYLFEMAGMVDGAGNSQSALMYSFTDSRPYRGVSYYRLRQVDFDGAESFSKTVPVFLSQKSPGISVFPNPASGLFYLTCDMSDNSPIPFDITDAAGRLVLHSSISGNQIQMIDLTQMAKGVYTLKSIVHGEPFFKRIVIH